MLTVNVNMNRHHFYLLLDLSQRESEPVTNVGVDPKGPKQNSQTQVDRKKLMLILQVKNS